MFAPEDVVSLFYSLPTRSATAHEIIAIALTQPVQGQDIDMVAGARIGLGRALVEATADADNPHPFECSFFDSIIARRLRF